MYDPNGNRILTQLIGGTRNDTCGDVDIDIAGGVYVTGKTGGNIDGTITDEEKKAFLVKYDQNNQRLWTRYLRNGRYDESRKVMAGVS